MATKRYDKQALFDDYLLALWRGLEHIESTFGVEGICRQVFGGEAPVGDPEAADAISGISDAARAHVEASGAWRVLSSLYDYAFEGLLRHGDHPEDIVHLGNEVLDALTTEHSSPSEEWSELVAMGDARFGIHDGYPVTPEKLALLANVDIRTVRNAISAGDLAASKVMGTLLVEHESAIKWLRGRRGFKPTRIINMQGVDLRDTHSPLDLAALLKERRRSLKLDETRDTLPPSHPAANDQVLNDLEDGVFTPSLDAAYPLADFYQLERTEFLNALMRCFYPDQYQALTGPPLN